MKMRQGRRTHVVTGLPLAMALVHGVVLWPSVAVIRISLRLLGVVELEGLYGTPASAAVAICIRRACSGGGWRM